MFLPSLVLSLALSAPSEAKSDSCTLAAGLREALQQRFGTSRVLKTGDLYEDERGLFRAEHPGGCPGLATGRFFGPKERPALALVLLEVEPKKSIRLVVARPALSAWIFHEVAELDQGSTPVVSRRGPGKSADARGAKAPGGGKDLVVLTGYESWERIYSWNGRAFDRMKTGH